jgi:pyruvate,water dikinase
VKNRPNHSESSNEELVEYAREMVELLEYVWVPSCVAALACSLGPGGVQAICDEMGRSEDAVKLMSAVGDVESAGASFRMWDLSRIIRNSEQLSAIFDDGSDGALEKIKSLDSDDAQSFITNWEELIDECGHRGPNEWDMRAHSWTTKPELPIGMLERLRFQEDDKSPHIASVESAKTREKLTAEVLDLVKDDEETHGNLAAAIKSSALFFGFREMGKNAAIRSIHEAKLAMMELGRRMVELGAIDEPQQLFMVTESELNGFIADPVSMRDTILERDKDFSYLHEVEPPYIVDGKIGLPPISEWPKRGSNKFGSAEVGEVLQGAAASPGIATGTARVILDPSDASSLEPGDIMIAPTTDPSWTPLFMTASAVIVNVGAVASHAAIVSRELGIPCAVSVEGATDRIIDGSTITVDGSTGTVTIDA